MNKPPIIPKPQRGGPNPDSPPPLLRSMTGDSAHSSSSCSSLSSESCCSSSSSSCSSPTTGAPTTVALHTLYNSSKPLSPRIVIDAIPEEDEGYGTDNDNATARDVDGYRRDSSSRRRRRAAILLVGMVGACVIMIMLTSITHHYSHGSYLPLPLVAMLSRIRTSTSHPRLDGDVNDGRPQPLPSRAGAPSIEKLDHRQGKELIDELIDVETSSSSSSIDTIDDEQHDDNEKPASIRSGSSQSQGDTKDKAHSHSSIQEHPQSDPTNDNLHHQHDQHSSSFTNLEHSISSTPLTPTQRYTHLYTMLRTYQIEGNVEAAMEIEVQLRGAARYTVGEVVSSSCCMVHYCHSLLINFIKSSICSNHSYSFLLF